MKDIGSGVIAESAGAEPAVTEWNYSAYPTVVAEARRKVARPLTTWRLGELAFTTELVTSELVTNAIHYAGGPVIVRLIRGVQSLGGDAVGRPGWRWRAESRGAWQ